MTWLAWIASTRLGRAVGAIACFLALLLLARQSGKREAKKEVKVEDHENAKKIDARVDDSRADPDRLRKYDDAGWRD